jgi:c-di-GMP-binding flagellar brake protein YcgR
MGSENFPEKERRKSQRLRVNITIVYRVNKPSHVRVLIGDDEVEATTSDISVGGMSILTVYDIPVAALLTIEFMIYQVNELDKFRFYKSIKATGEVRSNVLLENKFRRIGIVFKKLESEDKGEISNFVKSKIDSGNKEMFPDGSGN